MERKIKTHENEAKSVFGEEEKHTKIYIILPNIDKFQRSYLFYFVVYFIRLQRAIETDRQRKQTRTTLFSHHILIRPQSTDRDSVAAFTVCSAPMGLENGYAAASRRAGSGKVLNLY